MQTRLIALGCLLVVCGAIALGFTLSGLSGDRVAPPPGGSIGAAQTQEPSLVLPVIGGLCLAAGTGLIGIGANRWYATRERRINRSI